MYIIVGLGNPGSAYISNRHNIGFMVLDELAKKKELSFEGNKLLKSEVAIEKSEFVLVKPSTFMNNSGITAKALLERYSLPLVVVHDDVDIELGKIKCSYNRGAGGHNGVQSIIDYLNSNSFFRIRIGVRPVHEELQNKIAPPDGFEKFLLSNFAPFEIDLKNKSIQEAVEIILSLKKNSFEEVMNKYN